MDEDPRTWTPAPPGRRFVVGLVVAVVAVVLVAVGVVAVQRLRLAQRAAVRAQEARAPRAVSVVRVELAPGELSLRLPGEMRGFTETPVYAKIAGYLREVLVDKGDRVRRGQVLARLESPELDQQVRNARASFELKKVTTERFEALRRAGVVAQQEADQARSDFLQAAATLRELEAQQAYKEIAADQDGVVTARYADPGTLVPQSTAGSMIGNTPILALSVLSPLRVYVDLPQSQAPFVRDGDQAVVTVEEYPGRRFTGAVTRHPPALATATRTMLVEVDLPNDDGALLPGMYAQVTLSLAGRERPPVVPDDVLIFRDGRTWVPVVAGDTLRVVEVALGYDDGRMSEITQGLTGDELIAANVGQTARDGEKVQVRELPAAR